MKRIEVDPSDVRVVGPGGAAGGQRRDSNVGLRLKIAVAIAAVEVIVVAFGGVSALLMTLIAVGLVAFHFFVGRNLPTLPRHISWTLALAQALVALFIAVIGTAIMFVMIALILVLIIGVMLLLANRR